MFDKYLIVDDSLRATPDGFAFHAKLGYYRGIGLSMIEDLAITLDGEAIPRDAVRFDEGEGPITLDGMETAYDRRWGFGAVATISVVTGTPLEAGEHALTLTERLRVSYLPFPSLNSDAKTLTVAA